MQENVVYLTVHDIATRLKVTDLTVRRWIEQGQLAAIKLKGGQYRIHPDDFADFLKRQRLQP
jgi:excisionase family DNA binding protein